MTVLHSVIAFPTPGQGGPDVLLWGERDVEAGAGGHAPSGKRLAAGARVHPGAASREELGNALDALRSAGVDPLPAAQPDELRLRLPTRASRPVPSWDLESRGRGPVAIETWTAPAMRLGAGVAVPWLATLPAGPTEPEVPRQGPGLRYAAHLAKFVLSLLARHRFVPTVRPGRENRSEANGRPSY